MELDLNQREVATVRAALMLWLRDGAHIAANAEIWAAFDAGSPGLKDREIVELLGRLPVTTEIVSETRDAMLLLKAIVGLTPRVSVAFVLHNETISLEAFLAPDAAAAHLHRTVAKALETRGVDANPRLEDAIAQLQAINPAYRALGVRNCGIRGASRLNQRPVLAISVEGGTVTGVYADELAGCEAVVIDHDAGDTDPGDVVRVPYGDGRAKKAALNTQTIEMNALAMTLDELHDLTSD